MYYLSPVLIIQAAAEGIVAGSFILFSLQFVSALVLGRAFCGWVCPAAGLQEACFMARDKRATGGKFDLIKFVIWLPWLAAIVWMAVRAGGLHTIGPLYQTRDHYGISIAEPPAYIVFYFFIALIVVLALSAGKRAFCHYVCWMAPFMIVGRKVANLIGLPALRLRADRAKCVSCKRCTQNCTMSLEVEQMVQNEGMEHAECILCGTCADVCPKKVISYTFSPPT